MGYTVNVKQNGYVIEYPSRWFDLRTITFYEFCVVNE